MPRQTLQQKAQSGASKLPTQAQVVVASPATPITTAIKPSKLAANPPATSKSPSKSKSRSITPVKEERKAEVSPVSTTRKSPARVETITTTTSQGKKAKAQVHPAAGDKELKQELKKGGGPKVEEESKQMTATNDDVKKANKAQVGKKNAKSVGDDTKKNNGALVTKAGEVNQEEVDFAEPQPVEKQADSYLGPLPRNSMSAYNFFCAQYAKTRAENGQNFPMTEAMKICGNTWTSLSDEQKKPYHAFAAEDKTRFERQTKERVEKGHFTLDDGSRSTDLKNIHHFATKKLGYDTEVLPKKVTPAFFFYGVEQRKMLSKDQPELSVTEASKIIGQKWHELSADERAPYKKMQAEDKLRHERQLGELHQFGYFTLLDGSKSSDSINRPTPKKSRVPQEEIKQSQDAVRMPKKVTTAFLWFRCEQQKLLNQENPDLSLGEASKIIGLQWAQLSEEDRAPYQKLQAEDKLRLDRQLGEMHQFGYFKMPDGSKSTDAINRPTPKKRHTKQEDKEALKKDAQVVRSNSEGKKKTPKDKQEQTQQDNQMQAPKVKQVLTPVEPVKIAKKRKATAPLVEESKTGK